MENPEKIVANTLAWAALQQEFSRHPELTRGQVLAFYQHLTPTLKQPTFDGRIHQLELSNAELQKNVANLQAEISSKESSTQALRDELNRLTELIRKIFKGTGLRYWSTVLHAAPNEEWRRCP